MAVLDTIRTVNPAVLAPIVAVLVVFAVRLQREQLEARRELDALRHDRTGSDIGMLGQSALVLRLQPELIWSAIESRPFGVVVFDVKGPHPEHAARAMRRIMRGHENGFAISPSRFLVGLWDTDEAGVELAIDRLGGAMHEVGANVIDVGSAMCPLDGVESEELIALAVDQLRPIEQRLPIEPDRAGRSLRSDWERFGSILRDAWASLAIACTGFVLGYVVFPMALGSTVVGAAIGAAVGAAICVGAVWAWNYGAGWQVRSEPRVDAPLAVYAGAGIFGAVTYAGLNVVSTVPDLLPQIGFAASWILVLASARYLARSPIPPLIVLALTAGATTFVTYESLALPANLGRVVFAVALGCVLARAMERLSWVVMVAGVITIVDLWSVFSERGVTNQLLNADAGSTAASTASLVLLGGPVVDGVPMVQIGTTDLVFTMVFIATAHLWRMSVPRTVVALLAGVACASVVLVYTEVGIPVLPFLAVAFTAAHLPRLLHEVGIGSSMRQLPDAERRLSGA
jgi:hypothetical protein